MPQVQLYISPELDKKLVNESKKLSISKIDTLQKIIEDYFREKK